MITLGQTSVLLPDGRIQRIELGDRSTVQDAIECLKYDIAGDISDHRLAYLERDATLRCKSVKLLDPTLELKPIQEQSQTALQASLLAQYTSDLEDTVAGDEPANLCDFWLVDPHNKVTVLFNAYVRMFLGLPMWYLDIYVDAEMCPDALMGRLTELLCLSPDAANKFGLYGNYNGQARLLDAHDPIWGLVERHDNPSNPSFLQFMMHPACEDPRILGISRQSRLLYKKGGRDKNVWAILKGGSLFVLESMLDQQCILRIDNLQDCQVILRGLEARDKTFAFEIVQNTQTFRFRAKSKRRIDKWIKALRCAGPSKEINEPISMRAITEHCLARPPPSPVRRVGGDPGEPPNRYQMYQEMRKEVKIVKGTLAEVRKRAERLCNASGPLRSSELLAWSDEVYSLLIILLEKRCPVFLGKSVSIAERLVNDLKEFTRDVHQVGPVIAKMTPTTVKILQNSISNLDLMVDLYLDAGSGPVRGCDMMDAEIARKLEQIRARLQRPLQGDSLCTPKHSSEASGYTVSAKKIEEAIDQVILSSAAFKKTAKRIESPPVVRPVEDSLDGTAELLGPNGWNRKAFAVAGFGREPEPDPSMVNLPQPSSNDYRVPPSPLKKVIHARSSSMFAACSSEQSDSTKSHSSPTKSRDHVPSPAPIVGNMAQVGGGEGDVAKKTVEIDASLLQAILRDPKLANLVRSKASPTILSPSCADPPQYLRARSPSVNHAPLPGFYRSRRT